ncbi:Gfo/Idh/MocA family protein [Pseudonocardia sp. C8]|uniref:Gfo/Idh/MocA family protein n=1 Tax=Pseudonocardia sp. C8 TaxID=2762759 RepID=UPI002102F99B|nr:Gfo/Idh/MocA family oxidoreductase [Pseudonocardia sp. C8]
MTDPTGCTRVAVVGYGYWGSKHVRVLSTLPGVEVMVVDADDDRLAEAAAQYPAAERCRSLDYALDRVHAVVVAAPPGSHAELARTALSAGRHTLVEKPLTTSVEDAEDLVDLSRRSGALLMTGHTFEYNPAVWKLKEVVRSGELGRVLYIDAQRLSLGRYQADVDVVWDLAPHDISIVSFLLDEMPSAASVWAKRNLGVRHSDMAYLRLDFETARTHAFVHVSWLNPRKVRTITVIGERKMAVYDDMSDNERIRIYDIGVDPACIDDPSAAHSVPMTYRTGDIVSPFVPFREPLLVQDQHFIDCVRTGAECRTPGERGLDVVRVLSAADRATMLGEPVRVRDFRSHQRCARQPARPTHRDRRAPQDRRGRVAVRGRRRGLRAAPP